MKTLTRFFDDIHRLANAVTANRMTETLVVLSQEDKDLLREIRWHRVKKETITEQKMKVAEEFMESL